MENRRANALAAARFLLPLVLVWTHLNITSGIASGQESLPAAATADMSPTLEEALARRGDVTLRKSSLEAALMSISELWQVNIVAGELNGQVNGVFKNAPLREILDSVLLGNGYGYRIVGESIVVTPIAELGSVNPYFEQAAIPLRYVKPSEVATAVEVLKTPNGQIRALDSASALIVVDFPDRVKKIRELATKIDAASVGQLGTLDANGMPRPLKVMYRHLQFISAVKATAALDAVLSNAGRVSMIEGEDRIVVADYETNLTMARTVLDQIDRPRPQVKITALIYDISLQDLEALGLNWNNAFKGRTNPEGNAQTVLAIDSVTTLPFAETETGGTITMSNLSPAFDLSAVLLAVQNASDARLLADPSVFVMDNEEATFESVSEIPFQQLTETAAGGSIGTTAFRDAGIKLRVLPKIAADGTIELDVTPEFSRLTGFTPGDNQPIIDRRTAQTKLRVANGQTVMIGGLRQRSDVGDFTGIPGLKDRRIVGRLFRARETDIRESELVVFISPLVTGYAPLPNCREQRVIDTVRSRLDHIPQAEGAPPCNYPVPGQLPGAAVEMIETPTPNMVEPPVGPNMAPDAGNAEPALNRAALQYPAEFASHSQLPRRLPPVPLSQPALDDAALAASEGDITPLRPSFEDRFRATGGVYEGQQRVASRPNSDDEDAAPDGEQQSPFWRRMFR